MLSVQELAMALVLGVAFGLLESAIFAVWADTR